jgi:thiol-disulfide isomerase/thioredoxin
MKDMRAVLRLVALAAVLVLTGCAAPEPVPEAAAPTSSPPAATTLAASPSPSPAETSRASSPTPAPTEVPDTLAFTSTTVDGQPFDGASLAGKPVLLWFWAPWCPTCRSQADEVKAIAQNYDGKVAVIGVGSLSDDDAAIKAFAVDAPGPTHLNDTSGAVFRHFGVVQQSSFVLLDAAGQKAWSVGYGGGDDLADQVAAVAD